METAKEVNGHSIDISKPQNDTIYESNKVYIETEKDTAKSTLIENNNVNPKLNNSIATTVAVNPIKTVTSDFVTATTPQLQFNENGKYSHRRNLNQPNLQPLLKKPINSIATTKPLILPAPISDSFSQGTKTNIVTMHSNYSTSSVTSQFNNCQQQMAMGIATIQPQHFGYSGISNNRYPMMPISLQNSYSTQQLTLANGGIGTAVQLMPVMNQNTNQLNNSRVQSVPLFMTPILGAHSGMLFQPNMTIMPQNSNTVQAISIPNSSSTSSYSNDYNAGIAIQSPAMYSSAIRNPTTAIFTTEFEIPSRPPDLEPVNKAAVVDKHESSAIVVAKAPKVPTSIEPPATLVVRANVKHRELIRTQIYRMKPSVEESVLARMANPPEPEIAPQLPSPIPVESESISVRNIEFEAESVEKIFEITEYQADKACEEEPVVNECTQLVIATQTPVPEKSPCSLPPQLEPVSLSTVSNSSVESDTPRKIPAQTKPTTPGALPVKRKLPSPEILSEPLELPRKLTKSFSVVEKSIFEPKSVYKDISDRPSSVFTNSARHSNKLTAVVRPEQRKILVHYLDDLIVFESDEPFPTSNKMQVVKSALKAGNIKLSTQKSKVLPDHFLYTNTDDETSSPSQHNRSVKPSFTSTLASKTSSEDTPVPMETDESPYSSQRHSNSCLEPLSIDIPTTNTTSSCGSVDSSQVRPLSVCSHRSPTPVPVSMKRPVVKETAISPSKKVDMVIPTPVPVEEKKPEKPPVVPVAAPVVSTVVKDPIPVKQVSPVKQKPEKIGLDRPICEWSVTDVADFVKQTPGCDNYVAMFQNHEIDGEALLLLSNDNLIQGALNMKIGPALKLCARIEKRKALDPPQPH